MKASILRSGIAAFANQIPLNIAGIVAVTNVVVTDEAAVVYIRSFGDVKKACKWLKEHVLLLSEFLSKHAQLSRIPYLRFLPDTEAERLERIQELLTPKIEEKPNVPKPTPKQKSRAIRG